MPKAKWNGAEQPTLNKLYKIDITENCNIIF